MMFRISNQNFQGGRSELPGRGNALNRIRMAGVALLVAALVSGAEYRAEAKSSDLSAEQESVLATAREYALQYSNKLPDYICTQITRRATSSLPSVPSTMDRLVNPAMKGAPSRDVIEERLSYVGQRESYEVMAINGGPPNGARHTDLAGAISAGEFGSLMRHLFLPATKSTFTWKQMSTLQGRPVYVFAYKVPAEAGTHVKAALTNDETVARYDGLIYIEAGSKVISRITVGVHLPYSFPIRMIREVVDYTPVTIAGTSYSLPSRAEVQIQDDSNDYTNKIDFKNYHKFVTESTILTGDLTDRPTTALADVQGSSTISDSANSSANEPTEEVRATQPKPDTAAAFAEQNPVATAERKTSEIAVQSVQLQEPSHEPAASAIAAAQPQSPPAGQVRPQAPSDPTDSAEGSFKLRLSADLVLVPVVVRDAHGQAVGNLTRDNFELFDRGKRREIVSFTIEMQRGNNAEEKPGEGAARFAGEKNAMISAMPDFAVYLFDDMNLKAGELAQVKEAAARQFDMLQPTDRVAILTTSGVEVAGFTADRERLREALKKVRLQPPGGSKSVQCPQVSYYMADLMLNGWDPALQVAAADAQQCMLLADGKQAMRRAMMAAREVVIEGEHDSRGSLLTMKNAIRWLSQMPGKRRIILVSPGFYLSSNLQVEAANVVDEAIRAEVTISALDARGLYTMNAGGETAGGAGNPSATRMKFDLLRDEATVASNVMEEMAAGSGGDFVHNTNDLVGGFKQLSTPPASTYLLGFKPETAKLDGSFHALKVKVNARENLNLQARRGYFAVRP